MIRLFVENDLKEDAEFLLPEKQAHYVRHVMRLSEGEKVLLFNGKEGEWESVLFLKGKKEAGVLVKSLKRNQQNLKPCGLAFALIKKENTDFVLQKATELGVTDVFPILTRRTVVRNFNEQRAKSILIEAAEQCERLDVPVLHPLKELSLFMSEIPSHYTPVHLAERSLESDLLSPSITPLFIVGPEGGFTSEENEQLFKMPTVKIVHLGQTVLRAETASIAVLSAWQFRLF